MHEIGHALGLIHEHKRPDRNTFVTLDTVNIAPGRNGQFTPVDTSNCPIGTYDCSSIMHYGPTSFSVDGVKPTLKVVDPTVCSNIGQRNALSAGDLAAVRSMYDSITGLRNITILDETSDNGPALAFHDNALFLAWRGSGNDNLNVIVSDDGGVTFHGKMTLPESSDDSPALASHNGRLFIAFRGSGNEDLNVAVVSRAATGSRDVQQLSNKVISVERGHPAHRSRSWRRMASSAPRNVSGAGRRRHRRGDLGGVERGIARAQPPARLLASAIAIAYRR